MLAGAAEFAIACLRPMPDGTLGTIPATSPENLRIADDGAPTAPSTSTTCELELVHDRFTGLLRHAPERLAGTPLPDGVRVIHLLPACRGPRDA